MGLAQFISGLFFFAWLASSIFWAFAAAAYSSWARIDSRAAIPIGAIFQGFGLIGLLIYRSVRKANSTPNAFTMALEPDSFNNSQDASTYDFFGDGQTKPPRNTWLTQKPGVYFFAAALTLIATFTISLFLTWFNIADPTNGAGIELNAFSTGLEFWVFLTVLALVFAILVSIKKPSRIAAVILASFASWWLMLSMASLLARGTFLKSVSDLFQIPALLVYREGFEYTFAFDVGVAWYLILASAIGSYVISGLLIYWRHQEPEVVSRANPLGF